MKKQILTAVLGVLLFSVATGANASPMPPCPNGNCPPPPPEMQKMSPEDFAKHKAKMEQRRKEIDKRLKITDEQKAQLKSIHENSRAQMEPKMKELHENEMKLHALMEKKAQDKDVVALQEKIKKNHEEIKSVKRDCFEKTQAVFTQKQRDELNKMMKEHKKKMSKKGCKCDKCPPPHAGFNPDIQK